jgi:carbonic anhydrase
MMKFVISAAIAALAVCGAQAADHKADAKGHAVHWSYTGEGAADHWGDLESGFATCKLGKAQSPIDIRDAKKATLPAIAFGYAGGAAEVVNNGHTIQVNLAKGGAVKVASGEYSLLQFHFHTPSEEKINGQNYPLVAHLVHRNDKGTLAVVAVLFSLGKENATLKKVFAVMPAKADGKAAIEGGLNVTDMLPAKQEYFSFLGSLTTPPCSEGVRWHVLKQTVEMSQAQLDTFKKLYPMNARPVQPLNGRSVETN